MGLRLDSDIHARSFKLSCGQGQVKKNGWEQEKAALAEESPRQKSPSTHLLGSGHQVTAAANRNLDSKTPALSKTKHRCCGRLDRIRIKMLCRKKRMC